MRRIWLVIMFVAFAGNIALADDAGFSGEWVADSDDANGYGITTNIVSDPPIPPGASVYRSNSSEVGYIDPSSRRSVILKKEQRVFTVITADTIFEFNANGSKLTGSMIRGNIEEPLFDGKINGNKITFTIMETIGGKNYSFFYSGELSDDSISFNAAPSRDGGSRFQFKARRVSRILHGNP